MSTLIVTFFIIIFTTLIIFWVVFRFSNRQIAIKSRYFLFNLPDFREVTFILDFPTKTITINNIFVVKENVHNFDNIYKIEEFIDLVAWNSKNLAFKKFLQSILKTKNFNEIVKNFNLAIFEDLSINYYYTPQDNIRLLLKYAYFGNSNQAINFVASYWKLSNNFLKLNEPEITYLSREKFFKTLLADVTKSGYRRWSLASFRISNLDQEIASDRIIIDILLNLFLDFLRTKNYRTYILEDNVVYYAQFGLPSSKKASLFHEDESKFEEIIDEWRKNYPVLDFSINFTFYEELANGIDQNAIAKAIYSNSINHYFKKNNNLKLGTNYELENMKKAQNDIYALDFELLKKFQKESAQILIKEIVAASNKELIFLYPNLSEIDLFLINNFAINKSLYWVKIFDEVIKYVKKHQENEFCFIVNESNLNLLMDNRFVFPANINLLLSINDDVDYLFYQKKLLIKKMVIDYNLNKVLINNNRELDFMLINLLNARQIYLSKKFLINSTYDLKYQYFNWKINNYLAIDEKVKIVELN